MKAVEDANGTVAWLHSDGVGGVPRPFERPSRMKSMLSTLRFDTRCAAGTRRLDLGAVVALRLRPTGRNVRTLAFDDLQVVPA